MSAVPTEFYVEQVTERLKESMAENDSLRAQVAALTAERDALDAKATELWMNGYNMAAEAGISEFALKEARATIAARDEEIARLKADLHRMQTAEWLAGENVNDPNHPNQNIPKRRGS